MPHLKRDDRNIYDAWERTVSVGAEYLSIISVGKYVFDATNVSVKRSSAPSDVKTTCDFNVD